MVKRGPAFTVVNLSQVPAFMLIYPCKPSQRKALVRNGLSPRRKEALNLFCKKCLRVLSGVSLSLRQRCSLER